METGKRKITENVPSVMPQALPRVPGYCPSICSLQEKFWFVFATGNYFPGLGTSDTNCKLGLLVVLQEVPFSTESPKNACRSASIVVTLKFLLSAQFSNFPPRQLVVNLRQT